MTQIVVVGSINVDDIYTAHSLPEAGETVTGARYEQQGGGKGANQAVAAAFGGMPVKMIGMVGPDPDGQRQIDEMESMGVDCSLVGVGTEPTGRAAVLVGGGENQIVVASGANHQLSVQKIMRAFDQIEDGVLLVSAEIHDEPLLAALFAARDRGMTSIFNAAPARSFSPQLSIQKFLLVVNEVEAKVVGSDHQITTLGPAGLIIKTPEIHAELPAFPATVVDSTGAGDAFCGVLAASLAQGFDLKVAARRANAAGSAAVRVVGARTWRNVPLPTDVAAVLHGSP